MSTASILLLGALLSSSTSLTDAPAPPAPPTPPRSFLPAPQAPPGVEAPLPPLAPWVPAMHPHAEAPRPPRAPVPPRVAWSGVMPGFGPRLGTQVSTMTPALRGFFGAPDDAGLLVQGIEPGSAAEAARVKVGDVLVEVDGQPIATVSDVRRALADRRKGDVVKLKVVRSKKRKTLQATITDDGRASFPMPPGAAPMPDIEVPDIEVPDFEVPDLEQVLPPEARQHLDPETRAKVERQLEQAREQLRAVERALETLSSPDDEPRPEGKGKGESKGKGKGKTKGKAKFGKKKKAKAGD